MAYKEGKRAFEAASKSNHSYLIKDKDIQLFLKNCEFSKVSEEIDFSDSTIIDIEIGLNNPIEHIVAVDGGDTTVNVKTKFPSSQITFFQFGASYLSVKDLSQIKSMPFISPKSMAKIKELQRIKFVMPTKNIGLRSGKNGIRLTLIDSVRKALHEFFNKENYNEALLWFLFELYSESKESYESNARCPYCDKPYGNIYFKDIKKSNYTFCCQQEGCGKTLVLIDVFRLHEVIDNELGAGGVIAYVRNLIEQFVIIYTLKGVVEQNPNALNKTLFIKDGPLAFFGQTANMHAPMRKLTNYLVEKHNLFLIGVEKSGAFVDHALEVSQNIKPNQAILLSNKYIYSNITIGDPNTKDPYGSTSYFGSKVIFKSDESRIYVVSIPTNNKNIVLDPKEEDFPNLRILLNNIAKLKCDMYDNSLLPIAIANKLVSISDHPSSSLLEKFARSEID